MDQRIINYLHTLQRLQEPDDLVTFIKQAPPVGHLPPPQVSWVLAALIEYRRRLLWAKKIRRERINPLVLAGRLGDEYMEHGYVPGMPEWELYVEAHYTHLTNRVTCQQVIRDEDASDLELSWFCELEHFQNPHDPSLAFQRVMELFPSVSGVNLAKDCLRDCGALTVTHDEISPIVARFQSDFDRLSSRKMSLWLAAATGDWPAALRAAEEIKEPKLIALTKGRSDTCRATWLERLNEVARDGLDNNLICALGDAGGLDSHLEMALRDDETAGTAADFIGDDPRWCRQVYEVFQRYLHSDPGSNGLDHGARYLVRQGHRTTDILTQQGSRLGHNWHAVELALRHASRLVPELLRQGIRSTCPSDRTVAAAVLALVDRPWSRNELVVVLRESDACEPTAECRAALRESTDPEIRAIPARWEKAHCDDPPLEQSTEQSVRQVMSRLFDDVMQFRDTVSAGDQ